jgi:hypothetical protein
MSSFLQGAAARDTGTDFEKEISKSFQAYAKIGRAYLDFMPLPMSPCGIRHPHTKAPLYIPKGKAPFDVYGHAPVQLTNAPAGALEPGAKILPVALFVGAELKATSEPETSLPIVKPDKHASGIAYHQLAALALVARMGGIARIVWDNGGQIGVLREEAIMAAHVIYDASLQSEVRGKGKGPNGSRSIKWESFEKVDYANVGGTVCIDWLVLSRPR